MYYIVIYLVVIVLLFGFYKLVLSHSKNILEWFSKSIYKLDYSYTKTIYNRKDEIVDYHKNKNIFFQSKLNFIQDADSSLSAYKDYIDDIEEDYALLKELLINCDLDEDVLKVLNKNIWVISFVVKLKRFLYVLLSLLTLWFFHLFWKLNIIVT